jgi:glycosyltransferase involved in cell wall biosynthesis
MDDDKPALLWHSNAPWAPTGYGQQTALFGPHLKKHYNLAMSAFYGLEGNWVPWEGIPVGPGFGGGALGDEVILDHAKRFFGSPRGGLTVTLMDVWPLNANVWRNLDLACWCPVDHDPTPPHVLRFLEEASAVPIAMSRFGQERLPGSLYVPHAVDTDAFSPMPRAKARERTKLPEDAFVVGMVAANKGNPSRKAFPEALEAFAAFARAKEDALLYMHTSVAGKYVNGVNLAPIVQALDLADKVVFSDQYRIDHLPTDTEGMKATYASFDVLLNPSRGEGFGIPILEAQACGIPAIVTDFSAMSEVCSDAGWRVKYRRTWIGADYNAGAAWMADPDIPDIVDALEQAYAVRPSERQFIADTVRQHAENYALPKVLEEFMLPALQEARDRHRSRKPIPSKAEVAA